MTQKQDEQTIVIGIPGKWENRDAIIKAIEKHSGGYNFTGMMLINEKTKESFGMEIYEHDESLREAFEEASMGGISEKNLQEIDKHTFTLYIIGEGGSIPAAQKMMEISQKILQTGGLGVKIETAGKAFSPDQWNAICANKDLTKLFDAYIIKLQALEDVFYTCGMQNLGLKDAIVGAVSPEIASQTLDVFSIYQIVEQPTIHKGESFFINDKMPEFIIWAEDDTRFTADEPFFNRQGLWVLEPIH